MKCEFCRYAPPVNPEGFQDACELFDKYGTIWKDGREGCTMSPQTMAKNERDYWDSQAEMATEWGLEHDFENHGWDLQKTIKHCLHMIGYDRHIPPKVYHRHGKAFFKAYRNGWGNGKRSREDFDYMCHDTFGYMRKYVDDAGSVTYHLSEAGLKWLGRQIGVTIREED